MLVFKVRIKRTQCVLLLAVFTLIAPVLAQQPAEQPKPEVTLDQILLRMLHNYAEYRVTVPNLVADEHVFDNMSNNGASAGIESKGMNIAGNVGGSPNWAAQPRKSNVHYGAQVYLQRTGVGIRSELNEIREIKTIDGKTAEAGAILASPAVVGGAFSSLPSYILPQYKKCYDYKLASAKHIQNVDALVIEYATKTSSPPDDACPVKEKIEGRAYVDPSTMQLIRLEQHRFSHKLPGNTFQWKWSVEYAHTMIDGKPFWLPKTIVSEAITEPDEQVNWRLDASYSNYRAAVAPAVPAAVGVQKP